MKSEPEQPPKQANGQQAPSTETDKEKTRFVTQGTVQVEVKCDGTKPNGDYVVRINPTQDYSVKHNSDIFIVFISETLRKSETPRKGECLPCAGHLFRKSQDFGVDADDAKLGQTLIHAAITNTKVEIIIGDCAPPDLCRIQSVRIPASLSADK
jgi:hypothetical protein